MHSPKFKGTHEDKPSQICTGGFKLLNLHFILFVEWQLDQADGQGPWVSYLATSSLRATMNLCNNYVAKRNLGPKNNLHGMWLEND